MADIFSQDTRESYGQYAEQGERENVGGCESDTQEKLERDVIVWCHSHNLTARDVLDFNDRQAEITERECAERLNFKTITAVANELNADLQAQLDKLSSDELHWRSEADFWKRKYELICKALIDLNRNYVHVEDEGLA